VKKSKSSVEKIVENLVKLTTVPIEKSVIKWRMDKVFSQYRFETEYKCKIYAFDGRHFIVYPAGYELPPGVRIADKQGPDILLNTKINAAPKLFGELWMQVCGQHEKELDDDKIAQERENTTAEARQKAERERVNKNVELILEDFKRKQDF